MPKPDPALLDPARYPFRVEIQPRFGDLDINMHINNVALTGILEEGRVRFNRAARGGQPLPDLATMAVSFAVEYLAQAHHPEPLAVHVAVTRIGRTSQTLSQLVIQQGQVVAYAQVVLVFVQDDRPVEIPASYVAAIQPWMLRE